MEEIITSVLPSSEKISPQDLRETQNCRLHVDKTECYIVVLVVVHLNLSVCFWKTTVAVFKFASATQFKMVTFQP